MNTQHVQRANEAEVKDLEQELRIVKGNVLCDRDVEGERKAYVKKAHTAKYRACQIDGCQMKHVAHGYCFRHYTRLIRRPSNKEYVESPADFNKEGADDPLTEDEFCTMKDCRSQGFSIKDVAFEVERNVTVIIEAWEYETFAHYTRRHLATPWPEEYSDNRRKV